MLTLSEFFEKYEDFYQLSFTTDENLVDIRIDTALGHQEETLTRSSLKNLEYAVTVNEKPVKLSYKLRLNDVVECYWVSQTEISFQAENIPLNIIYQDNDLLVIDKPWGLVVHPAKGHESGTLANGILHFLEQNKMDTQFGEENRVGIVHRLDKDTRGLMLIALNEKTLRALNSAFQNRQITKVYKAIVKGITPEFGTIDKPIGRSLYDRKKMAVLKSGGRDARTDFKVLQRFKEHTLLACKLFTGRTHQIRVHLSHLGYPIVNDELYSRQHVNLPGMGLIACHLAFTHPTTGKEVSFTLPDPPAFTQLIKELEEKNK